MEDKVNDLLKVYGYRPVYEYMMARFKSDYYFLSELFQKKPEQKVKRERKPVEKSQTSTIGGNVDASKNAPDTPSSTVQQKPEKKPVVKKVITKPVEHDIIENKIEEKVEEDVEDDVEEVEELTEEEAEAEADEGQEEHKEEAEDNSGPYVKTSKCKDPSRQKLLNDINAKKSELLSKGIQPITLLTEEKMKEWMLKQKLKMNDICKMTGCYQQQVRDRARELNLSSPVPKKNQIIIAKSSGRM